jgi:hypothetical protein
MYMTKECSFNELKNQIAEMIELRPELARYVLSGQTSYTDGGVTYALAGSPAAQRSAHRGEAPSTRGDVTSEIARVKAETAEIEARTATLQARAQELELEIKREKIKRDLATRTPAPAAIPVPAESPGSLIAGEALKMLDSDEESDVRRSVDSLFDNYVRH